MSRHDDERPPAGGLTRRDFIRSWGAGTVAVAVSGPGGALAHETPVDEGLPAGEKVRITLNVNGRDHAVLVEPRYTLLHVLRHELGLTAAKPGCERGECGACTVLMDDMPRYACLTLAAEAEGARIETAEGLMDGEALGPVQESFVQEDALQCGYCTPGQIMAAEGLLRANPDPSFDAIRQGMSGNLCRCGAYAHIFNAVADAAGKRRG